MEIKQGTSYTQHLLDHVFYYEHELALKPTRKHTVTAISFTDIKERSEDFLNALVNTVTSWVYNQHKSRQIFEEQLKETQDYGQAAAYLTTQAFRKFRPGHPQGQFGELLLFNFLQHFFSAVPMLRKQRITTNPQMERNGADAIHYKGDSANQIFFLGESKCYESKYKFPEAFKMSLESIQKTFETFDKEIDLFVHEDFIELEVQKIASDFKNGKLKNVKLEFVCLVIYHENEKITLNSEKEIRESILQIVHSRCQKLPQNYYDVVNGILSRIHYIIFPVWALNDLLGNFQKKVGSE